MSKSLLGPPPPNYALSHPQILVAPLPDAASFFSGQTVQGEVFVKGLGQARGVRNLCVPSFTWTFVVLSKYEN